MRWCSMTEYVELGTRLYEVVVRPAPMVRNGRERLCHAIHDQQVLEVSDAVPEDERGGTVTDFITWCLCHADGARGWRLVPVVGRVA